MPKPKQLCMFCQKKFKNVRKHDKWCKARQKTVFADSLIQEENAAHVDNQTALHPRTELRNSLNKVWNCLSDGEKLYALATFYSRSEPC